MSEARKAFEAWAKLAFPHMSLLKKGDTDKYVYKTANFACEAFCEGEAWQASRQALEGEPTAIVNDSGVLEWYPPYNRPPAGTKLYTHPASADVPEKWRTVMKELADDLESEVEARRSGDLDRRIERDLIVVKEARVLLDEQEPGQ